MPRSKKVCATLHSLRRTVSFSFSMIGSNCCYFGKSIKMRSAFFKYKHQFFWIRNFISIPYQCRTVVSSLFNSMFDQVWSYGMIITTAVYFHFCGDVCKLCVIINSIIIRTWIDRSFFWHFASIFSWLCFGRFFFWIPEQIFENPMLFKMYMGRHKRSKIGLVLICFRVF